MKAYIVDIAYYLPKSELSNYDLAALFPEWSSEKVTKKLGIHTRHIASTSETTSDMACQAANKLFDQLPINKKSEIDFVLLCTQSPDYPLPTTACIIQEKLGLGTKCGALDFNLGCSGYVYGLSLAKGLIAAGIAQNVLFITAETYSKFLSEEDKENRSIFGDAATATLISTYGCAEIQNFSLGTDGSGANNLMVTTRCSDHTKLNEREKPYSFHMNGPEIFSFTLESVPKLVEDVLLKNSIEKEHINLFVFHQANQYMLEFLRKKSKIDKEKFYYSMEKVGNTVSSSIPIALCEAQRENRLNGLILLAGFGVGYSWGGVVLDWQSTVV